MMTLQQNSRVRRPHKSAVLERIMGSPLHSFGRVAKRSMRLCIQGFAWGREFKGAGFPWVCLNSGDVCVCVFIGGPVGHGPRHISR